MNATKPRPGHSDTGRGENSLRIESCTQEWPFPLDDRVHKFREIEDLGLVDTEPAGDA